MDTGPKTRPYISVSMGVIALLRFIEDKCYKCWMVCNNEDKLLLAITRSIFIYMLKVNPLNVKNHQNFSYVLSKNSENPHKIILR